METETAKITEARDGEHAPALPPFLASLEGGIDPRAFAKLAKLGEDYTETMVILRTLEGAKEKERFGPCALSNFEPDFIEAAVLTTGGGRVSVEVQPPNAKPWRFQVELPEAQSQAAKIESTNPPRTGGASGDALAASLAQIATALQAVMQTQQALSDRMLSLEARPQSFPTTRGQLLQEQLEQAVHERMLAAAKGEDPIADKAVSTVLSRVRTMLREVGEIKTLTEEASLALGAGKAAAEDDPVALAERSAAALDKFSQTRIGGRLLERFLPEGPATPLLTHESSGDDVKAVYG